MRQDIAREPSEFGRKRRGRLGHLSPEIVLTSDQGQITLRQLEILRAVSRERSQNRAAATLGISAAVFNRQLKELEKRAKCVLVATTRRGSELTAEGRQLLRILEALARRMERTQNLTVGCTPVSQQIVERVSSRLTSRGITPRIIVADDETNIYMSQSGLIDIVFLDDPQYAFEFPKEGKVHEVTTDLLIHCRRGRNYGWLNSGPQRLGFESLRQAGEEFEIKGTVFSIEELIGSRLSFFVSKLLLSGRRLELPGGTESGRIPYSILAVETTDHEDLKGFFECMAPTQHYPIG